MSLLISSLQKITKASLAQMVFQCAFVKPFIERRNIYNFFAQSVKVRREEIKLSKCFSNLIQQDWMVQNQIDDLLFAALVIVDVTG